MKAIQYRAYGGYEENRLVDLPPPRPAEGGVLIRMRTVGINPLDNTFRSGHHYAATAENLPRVGGQMGAGIVMESKSPDFSAGDRVFVTGPGFGIVADGTWRDIVAAPAAGLMQIPAHIDDDHAAAFLAGAGYLTGYLVLTEFVAFKPGQSILAPGIGGAVGMESVQIARKLGASLAISTASVTAKAEQARAAGYEHVIDLSRESLRDGVMRITDGKGVDVIIDGVGGKQTGEALGCLAAGGTYAVVGYAGGREANVNLTDIICEGRQGTWLHLEGLRAGNHGCGAESPARLSLRRSNSANDREGVPALRGGGGGALSDRGKAIWPRAHAGGVLRERMAKARLDRTVSRSFAL
jgi:NADPH:quinone reductase-like Zn-dependent oxidoreductase